MPPVHSPTAPSFRTRRRHVSPTTAGLFPECPDAKSPKQVVQSPARTEDRRGSISDRETTDCPPASTTQSGNQNREKGPVRNDVVAPPERANARLVGIARDRKSTRLNSSHSQISYAVFCLKKKKNSK